MVRIAAALSALFLALACGSAWAQPSPLIIDQNRADRLAPALPTGATGAPAGRGRAEAAPAGLQPFVLRRVQIHGSTAPAGPIDAAIMPFVGKTLDTAGLNALAKAVSDAYAKSDVALYTVLIPRQSLTDGLLDLRIVEGRIVEATVQPDHKGTDVSLAQAYAARLTQETPLRRSTLERFVTLMRDIPGSTVDIQLLQGAGPGEVKLVVKLKKKPFAFGTGINTRGTPLLGRTQVQADLTFNSLLRQGDQTQISLAAPTDIKRFQYYALTHSEPIGRNGLRAQVNLGYLHTRPKIGLYDISGNAYTAGATVSYPVIRGPIKNLSVSVGVDGLNNRNAVFGRTFSSENLRTARLFAAYSVAHPKSAFSVSATVSQGLGALGSRMAVAGYADPTFTKVNGQMNYTRMIVPHWVGRLAAGGQFTSGRLPGSEQYALGGSQFGRAFQSAAIVGDRGFVGSAELAWRPTKPLPKALAGSEAYVFADAGAVWTEARPNLAGRKLNLASVGGGFRAAVSHHAVIELEAAKAVDAPYPGAGSRPARIMVSYRSAF